MEALRYANLDTVPLKHKIRVHLQESSLLKIADGVIAHNPIMKSVLVEKGIPEHKLVSLEIFDYLIPNYQEKDGLSKDQPIIVAGNLAQEKQATFINCLLDRPTISMVSALTRAEHLLTRPILAPSCLMSFLQLLKVALVLSGMGIVRKPVVVFLANTFATTTLTRRRFI